MIELLKIKASKRHRKEIEPLPGKTWEDCYIYEGELNMHVLHYHIKDDLSSKAVHIMEIK